MLGQLIHEDQTGFMKNRRIAINIRRILDIMNWCSKHDKGALLLNIDFLKAFDRCKVQSILQSLNYFGFPEYVVNWIKTLYTDFTVKIQNNGFFSSPIQVQRSVHQGGCASAFLFHLLVETMGNELRQNLEHSLLIENYKYDINQYADDTGIFSNFTQCAFDQIIDELRFFQMQSGLTVNYDKTTVYRIGSLKDSNATLYTKKPLAWTNEGVNVLGIFVTHKHDIVAKNFEPVLQKVKSVFNSWKERSLTLCGKITVINTLISSLFVHKMTALPDLSTFQIQQLESDFARFIWNGAKAKIPLKTLQRSKKDGGLNLVDLKLKQISLKCTWIKMLNDDKKYAAMAYSLFSPVLHEDILHCNFKPEDATLICPEDTPTFWKDFLATWAVYNYSVNKKWNEQLIWFNSNIRRSNKPYIITHVYRRGLKYLTQLWCNNTWKDQKTVTDEFDLTVLQYNALKSATPKDWLFF